MKRKITNTYTNSTSDMKNKKKRILNIVSFDNLQKENNSQMITENNKPNTTKNLLSRSWNNMEVKNMIMNHLIHMKIIRAQKTKRLYSLN